MRWKSSSFCCRGVSESAMVIKIDRRNFIPKRTMVPDYGVAFDARNRTVPIFRYVCFFSCEKSLHYFQYFNVTLSRNVTFQNFDVLEFIKRLSRAFKNFHVTNVCIMTSGFNFRIGAHVTSFEKSAHLNPNWFMVYHRP